ncbi:PRD domain-containing protein [Paenibacillus glycanilyticus]|uniref:Transcription antiterminator BglG n=1 Tax=Paenibacillus glycanilyticus TaxID=126569 RepID=A0ABQ6GEL3_9BACL|nr:PRD domain-containing protein [Paenibacillus glycanilyticus]GLX69409.1 transcription antiterminator BglG [Paenibacillus glycanilyticus]
MGIKGQLRIDRIVGNNVILTMEPNSSREYVLFGKGIGFSCKGQKFIDAEDPRIEKRYRLDDRDKALHYHSLLEELDPEVVQISEQIIDEIRERLGTPVDPKVYFALPSHIQFVVYRLRNGMEIVNPFLYETKMCYPQEYKIASKAAKMISEKFDVIIPEDEVGFLTYHVYSAAGSVTAGQLVQLTELMNEIVERIEEWLGTQMSKTSSDYARLIMHLRYMMERILQNKETENPFSAEIRNKIPTEHQKAEVIAALIGERLSMKVSLDEIGYLAMHLYRLFRSVDAD